ncbi:MAG TPA: cation:proton antiporter [Pseudonocardiaceae bacterium]|nr:cation:proton antiporter [Pseudonocardiaceae bacterium]
MGNSTTAVTTVIFLDLAVMTLVGSLLAALVVRWRQPAVIGEIIAGILLGPTLLGALPGHLTTVLFPTSVRPVLSALASVGLVLFMFGIGYEIDFGHLRTARRSVISVALAGVLLPFGLGSGLGVWFYREHAGLAGHGVSELSFVLFLGVAMAITAFPVLARIIASCGLTGTRFGTYMMTCSAGSDVVAWSVLAFVTALITGHGIGNGFRLTALLLAYVLALVFVVRPALRWALTHERLRDHGVGAAFPLAVVGLFVSAWVTTRLGFQPIFGAFAFGAVFPRDTVKAIAPSLPRLIERASLLLVPLFFITAGLNADIIGLGARGWLDCLLVVAVACFGKFVGAATAARCNGIQPRRAAAIGVLMNSRGLTELVVIQVGVSLGVIDQRLTAMMIVMAVVTTVAATPLFRWLYNDADQVASGGAIQVDDRVLLSIGRD